MASLGSINPMNWIRSSYLAGAYSHANGYLYAGRLKLNSAGIFFPPIKVGQSEAAGLISQAKVRTDA